MLLTSFHWSLLVTVRSRPGHGLVRPCQLNLLIRFCNSFPFVVTVVFTDMTLFLFTDSFGAKVQHWIFVFQSGAAITDDICGRRTRLLV